MIIKMASGRKKLIITAGVLVFIASLLVFSLVFLMFRVDSLKKMIFESKKDLAFYDKRINNLKEIKKSLLKNQESYSKIEGSFLDEGSLVLFIQEIEFLARRAGVSLDIKSVGFKRQNSVFPSFVVFAEGPFSSIYKFLYLLENTKYQVAFERLNLQKDKDGEWGASLTLNFLSFITEEND